MIREYPSESLDIETYEQLSFTKLPLVYYLIFNKGNT